jgi:tetratricopeptide (TPR) repeat protein
VSLARHVTGGENEVKPILKDAIAHLDDSEEVHRLMGRAWEYQYEYWHAAIEEYSKAIALMPERSEAYYHRGMLHFRHVFRRRLVCAADRNNPDVLRSVADLRRFQKYHRSWERRGVATSAEAYMLEQTMDAGGQAEDALGHDHTLWAAHLLEAAALRDIGKHDRAVLSCVRAVAAFPYAAEPHALLADLCDVSRGWDPAVIIQALKDAIREHPVLAKDYPPLAGFDRRQGGLLRTGIDALREALRRDPRFEEAYVRLGRLQLRDGDAHEAWVQADMGLQCDPDLWPAMEVVAQGAFTEWMQKGRKDAALLTRATEAADRYIKLAPKPSPALRETRARLLIHTGKPEEAVQEVNGLLQEIRERRRKEKVVRKKELDYLMLRAEAYEAIPRRSLAEKDYTEMMELGGDRMVLLRKRARVRANNARLDDALADYDRMIDLDPNDVSVRREKAALLLLANRPDDAAAEVRKALKLNPRYAPGLLLLAEINWKNGDAGAAKLGLSRALDIDPGLARAYLLRGRIHAAEGRKNEAKADLDRAAELHPTLREEADHILSEMDEADHILHEMGE